MRVLITGGFGYLGGRLARHLLECGCEVILGTRHDTGPPDWLSQAAVVRTAWDSSEELAPFCAGVDSVIHAAGMNARDCGADPVAALDFNGVATARLLRSVIHQGVHRFIYLSTAHVYGSPLDGRITEQTCPTNLHPYATSHRAGEDIVRAAHQSNEIEGITLRLSNAFGAPVHRDVNCWMLLFNDLCRQAVSNCEMVLHSSGQERRDFVPIADVCHAVEHLLRLSVHDLGEGLYNVGGAWSPTLWEAAGLIQERCETVLGFRPKLTRKPPKKEEFAHILDYRIDALRATGFEPADDRIAEIDRLITFCKNSFS